MSLIYIDETNRLKGYSVSGKGSKSVVKIEIECSDPRALGYLLEQLGEIDREQKRAARPTLKHAPKEIEHEKVLRLPAPPALIGFRGGSQ